MQNLFTEGKPDVGTVAPGGARFSCCHLWGVPPGTGTNEMPNPRVLVSVLSVVLSLAPVVQFQRGGAADIPHGAA